MSELQISLLAIGFLVVVGVYAFNRFQEWKYRRRAEKAFPAGHKDVLLQENEPDTVPNVPEPSRLREEPRIEPVISARVDELAEEAADEPLIKPLIEPVVEPLSEPLAVEEMAEAEKTPLYVEEEIVKVPPAPVESRAALALDETIDYVVKLHPGEPVRAAALVEALQIQGGPAGKRSRWLGLNPSTGNWEEVGQGGATEYHNLAATLQLADRSGPVSEQHLVAFCGQVQALADALVAIPEFPDRQTALARAVGLDQFGADVDVLIGVNVITQDGIAFPATKVRAMAESAGMKLLADGTFHFINDEGADLFSLGNLDPTPFSPENIRQLSTHGVTFLFDVPRVADGVRVFNQMLTVAKQMASSLGGQVVDDNRRVLTDSGIGNIKQQLAGIYARMDAQQIKSGSARALRLFS